MKKESSTIKLQKLFFSNLSLFFFCVLLISPWLCSRTLAADDDVLLSQEERQQLADIYNTLKDTTKQSQTELKKYLEKWTQIKDKYGNAKYPSILETINKMEEAGVTHKLNTALKGLGKIEQGLNQIDSAAGKIQPYVNFYNRYKPDSENPVRPLEQISNLLEDLNSQIEKYDPSGGIVTKPIRAFIEFYQKAASSFASGLTRLQEKINERRGGCIGEGAGWFSSKDKKFIDLKTGDTICPYSGIKLDRAEIWVDVGGDGSAYIWWNNQWKKIKPGIGCVEEVNRGWLLAFGEKVSTENLISRCNTNWKKVLEAKKLGTRHYNSLFSGEECVKKILKHKKLKLERLGMEEFIAKYMFRADFKRKIDRIIRTVENTVLVMGTVEEEAWPHKSISGARIKASGGGASAQGQSEPGGWFTLVFELKPDSDERRIAKVTVTHNDYETYKGEKRLWKQCEDSWYGIRLEKKKKDDGTDSTSDDQLSGGSAGDDDSNGNGEDDDSRCGANEVKNESGDCVCLPGFEKVNGVCKPKCGENQTRDESGDCVCAKGFEKINGQCIIKCREDEERIGGNCVAKCGANEERNAQGVCVCIQGYESFNGRCIAICGQNEQRDDQGNCVCIVGYKRIDGRCLPVCSANEERDQTGYCVCKAGYERVGSQCLVICGPNEKRDDRGYCVCKKGYTRDDKGHCKQIKDKEVCASDHDCPQGYVCDSQSGKCVPPFDDSHAGFSDQLAQKDDQRTWDNAQQVISDQSANTDKDKFTSDDLDQDLDKIQDYLSVECSDKKPCPDGYNCENGKCVKKHDDDKQECTKSEDCPKDHECKDGKCVEKSEVKPKILAITPANKAVKINEPVTLQAILKMEDGSTKDVTREATWNPGNPFSKGNIGQYTVKATYKNLSGTAMITVVKEKGMQDITVNSKTINVTFFDHGKEDGDMIDVLMNGKAVFAGITLTKAPQSRSITMNADVIVFGFRALNEGTISPNTATVIFTDVTKGKSKQKYELKKNQKTNMNITYSP